MEDDPNFSKMKDNLYVFKNGRRPKLFLMEDDLNSFKMEDNLKAKTFFRIG